MQQIYHQSLDNLEERFPLLSQRDAPAEEVCIADEVKVIEFGDSYEAPQEVADTGLTSKGSAKKKGRTIAVTTKDMQKRRNDVKARTTLLLAFPDEHQLRFNKYKTAPELWAAILKTFEGKETLEQTFNRLQAIVSHLEFIDVEIEQDDLNQKFLTSLALEWLMYMIVWRNRSNLDTMSLNDIYNHLKVYEPKVQKKSESNSQNMAFISSAKTSSGKEEVNTASFSTASTQNVIDDKGYWDTGCSWHMTSNISYHSGYEPYDGGYVSFGQGGGKITGKGRDFKLKDDSNVLLRTPRQHDMYSIDLNNIVPNKDLTCLVVKASTNESMAWHRRLGHLNFKTMNKLVSHNLVRGLPSKCFKNDHTCVACLKGKQHKASCKTKLVHSVSKPIHTLHMDLFGPTSVSSRNHKWYCLVMTDDFSRFTWTSFLKTKDETSGILRNFITKIENLKELKIKIIRCDNRGEFRNKEMNDFYSKKGIKREFSNARTPQQNGVAERRNRTLIEAARTMLVDAKLHVTFWAEAVNIACYVQNRVLVNKSKNKTPYELFNGRTPAIGFLKPFGCHVMILNTLDNLGNFDAKGDEEFLENKLIEKGAGPNWLFDIDTLTNSMNYVPMVVAGTSSTNFSGTKDAASQDVKKDVSSLRYIAFPNWFHEAHLESSTSTAQDACNADAPESSENSNPTATLKHPPANHMETLIVETLIPTVSSPVLTACIDDSPEPSSDTRLISKRVTSQDATPSLDNILTLSNSLSDGCKERLSLCLVDYPKGVMPIGTKWVIKNKKDERGIVIRNKARLVAQRHTQEEGIDYEEVFTQVASIEAIRLFLAYASFMGFTVYQMDVKSVFLYGTIDEEVYGKDKTGKDVDLHNYRSMIGSLMYLTASRPDIMFAVYACARHQLTPKECHMHVVKRIFRYLKGHPKLGLWYPKESPFDLVAYSDSEYGGATQDRKSTTGGCQFWGSAYHERLCLRESHHLYYFCKSNYLWLGYRNLSYWGVLRILMISLRLIPLAYFPLLDQPVPTARLAFCDYHDMIAILEKYEHNIDLHQIVDFVEASHIRYALTINPTVYVSHIRQFWSTARIETTDEGTKILATVDGKPRTISESSIRRNLKLNDEAGISSLPDAELFETLH
nr:hypothetical protein [Tanacetum cinerariifolium]